MRAVRRKPDIEIEADGALRIALIAAAAFSEIGGWTKFIGELATELSFEVMTRRTVGIVWEFVEVLRHLEPALWQTTSRADAALQAAFACTAPDER